MPDAVIVEGDCVALDAEKVWADTAAFTELCSVGIAEAGIETLRAALRIYRGPLLCDFSLPDCPEFEAWCTQERAVLERRYLNTLETLWERLAARGAYAEAIACAQRYLVEDELAERVHARLIQLYAANGDRAAAMRQYEHCLTILERELGVPPLPETRAAYISVLQDQAVATPVVTWTTLPSLSTPLIGRDDALGQLLRAFARAREGRGGFVFVTGEPGIGKSRLLQTFAEKVQARALVAVGAGHEVEQDVPYGPLVEAMRSMGPAVVDALADLGGTYKDLIARLMPDMCAREKTGDYRPLEPQPQPGLLFEALVRWLQRLALRHTLVLCLDDLQWCDRTTLAWLGYLSRHIRTLPVLVASAYRSTESDAVTSLRTQLGRAGIAVDIPLERLTEQEVQQILRHVGPGNAHRARLSQRLHRFTGGNPFFLLETLRAMYETGQLRQSCESAQKCHEDGWERERFPLPDSVNHTIHERLDRLEPQTRQVLEAGAVLGYAFDFDLVVRTSGRSEEAVLQALETLAARQLLMNRGGRFGFQHDLIRSVSYQGLSYGRRRLLHRRAAEALTQLRPQELASLVRHCLRGDRPRQAAEFALQACQHARAIFAYAEARTFCEQALAALAREAAELHDPGALNANGRLRMQALDERGWVLRLLGEMDAYTRDTQEVGELARRLGEPHLLGHQRLREASGYRWFCRYAEAMSAAEAGLALSQEAGDMPTQAQCWREVGLAAREMGLYERAHQALEQSLELFAALADATYEIHVLSHLSTLACCRNEPSQAMLLARQSLDRCVDAGLPLERRLPLGDMAAAALALGELDQAETWLQESYAIAASIADRTQEILCLGHLGWLHLRRHDPNRALVNLQVALELAERIGSLAEQPWLHAGLAEACCLAADVDQASRHARRALELATGQQHAFHTALARRAAAHCAEISGAESGFVGIL